MLAVKDAIDDLKMLAKVAQPPASSPYCKALLSNSHSTPTPQQQAPTNTIRAHVAIREHQVLLDPDTDHPQINNNMSKESMVNMLKQAISSVVTIDSPQIQIKSITKLCNQGILLELNSVEAATWLSSKIRIKDRQYNVVVPFLPVPTDISDPATLQNIEHENNIPEGAINMARWIKDPSKHDEKQ
ncbi:hypothetical protein EDD16DRAFT_1707344 [Pisolithus croceorrhizus]|nr:hypothetical protein EDD16DRAFT_1707344 [Pisolithus croceorrhizus]